MTPMIVSIAERPDLAPIVAGWHLEAFGNANSPPFDVAVARVRNRTASVGPEQSFVLLHDGVPAGTASLRHHDLDARPELTPWLSSVFVEPAYRQRGFAMSLARHVEHAARMAAVPALWLYTWSAESLYRRLGWVPTEQLQSYGRNVVVMRLDLA